MKIICSLPFRSAWAFAGVLALFSPGTEAASAYVDALNAEILGGAPSGGASSPGASSSRAAGAGQPREELPANLSRVEFEEHLKSYFYGSYLFYNKLDDTRKQVVYETYGQTPRILSIREKITSLLKD